MASLSGVPPFFHFHCVTSSGSFEPPVVKTAMLAAPDTNERASEPPADPVGFVPPTPFNRFQSSLHPAGVLGPVQAVPSTTEFPSSSTKLFGISCAAKNSDQPRINPATKIYLLLRNMPFQSPIMRLLCARQAHSYV